MFVPLCWWAGYLLSLQEWAGRGVPKAGANINEIVPGHHLLVSPQDHLCWWLLSAAGLIPTRWWRTPGLLTPVLLNLFRFPVYHALSSMSLLCPFLLPAHSTLLPVPVPFSSQDTAPSMNSSASLSCNPLPFFIPPCIPPRLGAHSLWGT